MKCILTAVPIKQQIKIIILNIFLRATLKYYNSNYNERCYCCSNMQRMDRQIDCSALNTFSGASILKQFSGHWIDEKKKSPDHSDWWLMSLFQITKTKIILFDTIAFHLFANKMKQNTFFIWSIFYCSVCIETGDNFYFEQINWPFQW